MRKGRGVEQLSVEIRLGPDPIMTSVFSERDSADYLTALDGDSDHVDDMCCALMLSVISRLYGLPQELVLQKVGHWLDEAISDMEAEMADPSEDDLPF